MCTRFYKRKSAVFFSTLLAFFLLATHVSAITIPDSADVARIEQQNLQRPITRPTHDIVILPTEASALPLTGSAKTMRFRLQRVILEGNNKEKHSLLYSYESLKPYFAPYLGKVIALEDLNRIARAITIHYRKNGYVLTKAVVPAQSIRKDGVVRIRIIEAYISEVAVSGKVPQSLKNKILHYAEHLKSFHPLHVHNLERYALLVNDLPGITARAILSPATKKRDSAKLTFITSYKANTLLLASNNRGSEFLGPNQFSVRAQTHDFLHAANRTSFSALLTNPTRELGFFELSSDQFIGNNGGKLALSLAEGRTRPGFTLAPLSLRGKSKTAELRYSYPLVRTRQENLYWNMGLKLLDSQTHSQGDTLLTADRIRSLILGMSYEAADRYHGFNLFSVDFAQGLNAFGARPSGSPELSRPQGHSNYTSLRINASRMQKIREHVSALLAIRGQMAFSPLLSPVQFGIGGSDFGLAYDSSEIVGDQGLAGKLELHFNLWPTQFHMKKLQLLLFYDLGVIWNRDTVTQLDRASISSAGAGLRFYGSRFVQGSLIFAKPLTRPLNVKGNHAWRTFFNFSVDL